jgi:type II secretory pathway pseudopilin PulG
MIIRTRFSVVAAVLVFALTSVPAAGQDSRSSTAAKQLAQALDSAKLDAIAAPDPSDPSTYVAALYIQGSQLLVVSAKYAAPPLLAAKMKTKEFRDIYIDLSSASIAGSKVFIIDQNCNGLFSKPDGNDAPDSWEAGTEQVTFDGEWRKAKLTEEAYGKAFSTADDRYAKILALLTAQAKQ